MTKKRDAENQARKQVLRMRAREMRSDMTPEEGLLWHAFLKRYPIPFRRQYVVGEYILDFYCRKKKLAIELDGSQHYTPKSMEYDRKRTVFLESQGIQVLRFTNRDVKLDFKKVCEQIDLVVRGEWQP